MFLLDEDIADPAGGVSQTTAGLSTRFGKHRVRATPISEQAIETVPASVAKTGRAVVVHSAVEFGGFGAELAARIQSELFGQLKEPVMRVGARYTPVAFSSVLEAPHFPDADGIAAAATGLMTAF